VLVSQHFPEMFFLSIGIVGMFSQRQKEWLRRRDTDSETGLVRCQFQGENKKGWSQCPMDEKKANGVRHLHCHHIIPAGWFKSKIKNLAELPDEQTENFPENGIVLCEAFHHNGPKGVHPDYAAALPAYRNGNKNAFKEVAENHSKLENEDTPYWNQKYDNLLWQIANERTQDYLATNPDDLFPYDD